MSLLAAPVGAGLAQGSQLRHLRLCSALPGGEGRHGQGGGEGAGPFPWVTPSLNVSVPDITKGRLWEKPHLPGPRLARSDSV